MGTFELPVKAVTAEVLERLRDERVKEGLQLEYKESLPIDKTRDKFLSSVTAFANSSGGDLIFGIKAKRDDDDAHTGEIEKVVGLPGINFDLETQRLHNWVRSCIEPRLLVTIEPIERGNEPACLMVRVPRSWTTPHLVTTIGNPFYGRHSGGKYQLSSNEIRQAFIIAATARDRVREFASIALRVYSKAKSPRNWDRVQSSYFTACRLTQMTMRGSDFEKPNGKAKRKARLLGPRSD